MRQDARRGPGRAAPRHRERRGRAAASPSLMQGYNLEDIARGIDEMMIRQPLGVVAAITPFNFPGMIPLLVPALRHRLRQLLHPQAVRDACRSRCASVFELIEQIGLPPGVVSLVNGGKREPSTRCSIIPMSAPISFVGSTPVAKYVYAARPRNGKRAQCQGGAKNPVVVLPDADMEMTTQIVADSAFGCAGQRCLAASVAITVGDARRSLPRSHRRRGRQRGASATASTKACRWGRSSPPRASRASKVSIATAASARAPRSWSTAADATIPATSGQLREPDGPGRRRPTSELAKHRRSSARCSA